MCRPKIFPGTWKYGLIEKKGLTLMCQPLGTNSVVTSHAVIAMTRVSSDLDPPVRGRRLQPVNPKFLV